MNPDGVAYLDLGDDFVSGDWRNFINAHWSPLYPVILGTTLHLSGMAPADEFQAVHVVNFFIYLYVVAGAGWLARELLLLRRRRAAPTADPAPAGRQECVFLLTFFLLFWAIAVRYVGLALVTPDMLLFGTALLCLAIVLRIRASARLGLGWCLLLGLTAGIGYLAKAPLLPLFPVLALAVGVAPATSSWRSGGLRATVATAALLIVAVPWVLGLDDKYNLRTYSESSDLNRLWVVSRTAPLVHWREDTYEGGTSKHPTRVVLESPVVYEFGQPVSGTYPPWKDPAYWMAGARPKVDLRGHARQLGDSAGRLGAELWQGGYGLLTVLFIVGLVVRWRREGTPAAGTYVTTLVRDTWPLLLFGTAGLLMFSLVLVEKRYVAAFWFALFAVMAWGLTMPSPSSYPKVDAWLLAAAAVPFMVAIAPSVTFALWVTIRGPEVAPTPFDLPPTYHHRAAVELRRLGIESGTPVAVFGGAGAHQFAFDEYWARLCRARIVAEAPARQPDVLRDPAAFQRVLAACRAAGARFAILTPDGAAPEGTGREVPGTQLRVFDLREP
jgi:4-amino-4-deoxy-L-arabinose transferase-like glycosyltransferase